DPRRGAVRLERGRSASHAHRWLRGRYHARPPARPEHAAAADRTGDELRHGVVPAPVVADPLGRETGCTIRPVQKVERLVNLIALLLNTRRPLTVEEIRNTIPGYQQEDYSSFKRMFERDKEELRSLGIPIERRYTDVWEVEEGYLISKDRYYLPELDLTPDEMAAPWIGSR